MKRMCLTALLVLATGLAATAQNRSFVSGRSDNSGSPPRTTMQSGAVTGASQTSQRTFVSPPARRHHFGNPCFGGGVSPLIPSAMGCTDTRFTSGFFFPGAVDQGPVNLHPRFSDGVPVFADGVPVYAPYPTVVEGQPEPQPEPEPPALTIFERRSTYAPPPPHTRAATSQPLPVEPSATAKPESAPVPITLVYRDGRQSEVLNYAIVGQTLYNMDTFVAQKIPLSNLDLKATIKANQERGAEFSLPPSVKGEE